MDWNKKINRMRRQTDICKKKSTQLLSSLEMWVMKRLKMLEGSVYKAQLALNLQDTRELLEKALTTKRESDSIQSLLKPLLFATSSAFKTSSALKPKLMRSTKAKRKSPMWSWKIPPQPEIEEAKKAPSQLHLIQPWQGGL